AALLCKMALLPFCGQLQLVPQGEFGLSRRKQFCVLPNERMSLWRLPGENGSKQANDLACAVFTPFALQKAGL
ncbi:hypothetical protein, partial [Rheinheimera sp.]|uniref:hypothetical protein n=1 Tax=Rheinheimera sp. TaxID=1869214 RepID=UPI002FDDE5C0